MSMAAMLMIFRSGVSSCQSCVMVSSLLWMSSGVCFSLLSDGLSENRSWVSSRVVSARMSYLVALVGIYGVLAQNSLAVSV